MAFASGGYIVSECREGANGLSSHTPMVGGGGRGEDGTTAWFHLVGAGLEFCLRVQIT